MRKRHDKINCIKLESYRSGHNEAVLKTVWVQAHGGSNPSASATEKVSFVGRQKGLFSMISVPCGTGYIACAMISSAQMIYASRMKGRILYHACVASISHGNAVYHIAQAIHN